MTMINRLSRIFVSFILSFSRGAFSLLHLYDAVAFLQTAKQKADISMKCFADYIFYRIFAVNSGNAGALARISVGRGRPCSQGNNINLEEVWKH